MREKLLVIEDNLSVLASLTLCLKSFYEIESASTVRAGIEAFTNVQPALVLLDLRLPDGGGLEVLREIRQTGATTPVIILTGYASMGTVEEALRLGASDYLHKPFDIFTLNDRIATLIAASQKKAESAALDLQKLAQIGVSPREIEVLKWMAEGKRDSEIAVILSISVRTVNHHVASILRKLDAETRTAAVEAARSR